eukprot:403353763
MKSGKATLNHGTSKGLHNDRQNDDLDYASDSPTEEDLFKSYDAYEKELIDERKRLALNSEELEDVAGKKPTPMTEEQVMNVLKGHRFKFSLDSHFEQYSTESRKIAEKILKRSEVNLQRGIETIKQHLQDVQEPQYRSVFLMRLLQVSIEQVKPREVADLVKNVFIDGVITKQQIRRGLVRLFWRLEDILLDYPRANQVLAQIMVFLHLRQIMSSKILTQIPREIRQNLLEQDSIKEHFSKEIEVLQSESVYREHIKAVLKQYYSSLDEADVRLFLGTEIKEKKWEIFNYLFIKKSIDMALDKNSNEKDACSKLLSMCTQEYNFGNNDFGYAFDDLLWNQSEYSVDVPQFCKLISEFIAKAIYDGAVTYRYITDAELSYPGEQDGEEEKILQSVLNVLSVMPLDYHMKNLWNPALSNEELSKKFKSTVQEFLQNQDIDYVGRYIKDLNCNYYYHEFVKRAIVLVLEKENHEYYELIVKLLVSLNHQYALSKHQIELGLQKTDAYMEELIIDVPKAQEHYEFIKSKLLQHKLNE